jgi:hypothetical protein
MNRNWSDWRNLRDLIGGIALVLLIGGLFILPTLINSDASSAAAYVLILSPVLSFAQFFYLIPVMLYFQRKRRVAILTGVSIGSIITILFCTAVCWSTYAAGYADFRVVIVPPLLGVAALTVFYARSGKERKP